MLSATSERAVSCMNESNCLRSFKQVALTLTGLHLIVPQQWDALLSRHSAVNVLVPLWYLCCACSFQLLDYIPHEFLCFLKICQHVMVDRRLPKPSSNLKTWSHCGHVYWCKRSAFMFKQHEKQNLEFLDTYYSIHLNCTKQLFWNSLCWAPNWLRGSCGRCTCFGPLSGVPKSVV